MAAETLNTTAGSDKPVSRYRFRSSNLHQPSSSEKSRTCISEQARRIAADMTSRRIKLCTGCVLITLAVIAITLSVIFIIGRKEMKRKESLTSCLDFGSDQSCPVKNMYPFYATKTDYLVAKEAFKGQGDSKVPDVCKPEAFYLYSRHAIRYPDREKIENMVDKLFLLRERILRANISDKICEKLQQDLQSWKLEMIPDDDNRISDSGKIQSEQLGVNFKRMFPTLLGEVYSADLYDFGVTKRGRTEETAHAFAKGVFNRDLQELKKMPVKEDIAEFHKGCEAIMKQDKNWVKSKPEEVIKFKSGETLKAVLKDISLRLGITVDFDTLDLLLSVCEFEFSLLGNSPWCPLFKTSYIKVLEYLDDIDDYYQDGYGKERNYKQACPMVKHLVQRFWSVVNGSSQNPKATLIFSHAGAVKKVLARFGLFEDDHPLKADQFCSSEGRKWRSSFMCPFNANLAFALYNCSGTFNIQAFLQEKPVILKGCTSNLCPWETFSSHYNEIAETCDFNEICKP